MSRGFGVDPMLLVLAGGALWLASRGGGLSSLLGSAAAAATATPIAPRSDFSIPQSPQPATSLQGALFTPPPPGAPPMPITPPHPGMLGTWSLQGGPEPFNMEWVWIPAGSVAPE